MSNLLLISSSKANLEKRNRKKNCPTFQFVHEAEAAHCFEGIEVGQEAHETGIEREASKINYFVDVVLESNEYLEWCNSFGSSTQHVVFNDSRLKSISSQTIGSISLSNVDHKFPACLLAAEASLLTLDELFSWISMKCLKKNIGCSQ